MYRVPHRAARITFRPHGPRFSSLARLTAKDDDSQFRLLDTNPVFRSFASSLDNPGGQASVAETSWLANSIKSDRILDDKHLPDDASLQVDHDIAPSKSAPGNRCRTRCAIITGGTSGIGYAVAKSFVLEGASRVILATRNTARGERTVEKIKRETGLFDAPLTVWQLDFSEKARFSSLFNAFPLCNTLINCAGVGQSRLLHGLTPLETESILDTNLGVPALLISQAMRAYFARRKASRTDEDRRGSADKDAHQRAEETSYCIINVASLLANKGGHGASVYAASKAGLLALTRAACLEAAEMQKKRGGEPPFRVNAVVPGYISTPMTNGIQNESRTRINEQIPLGRFGTPEEVADAVLFLVANEYANNCVLNLDGGLSAT